jgi:hypothetical protein
MTPPTSVTTRKKYATRGQISVVCVVEVFKDLGSFGLGPLMDSPGLNWPARANVQDQRGVRFQVKSEYFPSRSKLLYDSQQKSGMRDIAGYPA